MSRKISFSGIILAGTLLFCTDLSAQRLCRNDSTGFVRWVSGNCPSGFTNINNSVRSEYLRANSVTTDKIQDGAVSDEKIAGVSAIKVDFSNWTAPTGSVNSASVVDNSLTADDLADDAVDTAEIKNGAVTNLKINIDTDGPLPYHTFLSTVNLTSTGTGYIPLIGYNLTPQATETGLTASAQAFGCFSGTITVVLDTAPGSGKSRTFELRNGTTPITGSSITVSGTNKIGSTNVSFIPLYANLVLHAAVSGTPAPARATIYFVCK